MKIRLILALALLFLASACATVKPETATEPDAASAYIQAVESIASGRAMRVLWVNPPRNQDLERRNKG